MQLTNFCQIHLHSLTAILVFLYFINMTNSALTHFTQRNGRRGPPHRSHHNQKRLHGHTDTAPVDTEFGEKPAPPSGSFFAEQSPTPTENEEDTNQESSSSSEIYSSTRGDGENETRQMCPSCQLREHQRALRIESIKRMILDKLRMSQAPNITRPSHLQLDSIPPLEHLRNNPELNMQGDDPMMGSDDQLEHSRTDATTEKIITFAKRSLPHVNQTACCYFNISHQLVGYSVSKATLYFYVKPATLIVNPIHELVVKQVVINKSTRRPKGYAVRSKKVELNPRHGEWLNVEFTSIVQDWANYPEANLGIALELLDDGGNNLIVTEVSEEEEKRPFLQLRLRDERVRRSKRSNSGPICVEDDHQQSCCRYPLRVDFSEFSWDWIIAPKNFEANFCSGVCPQMITTLYPHTQIMSIVDPVKYSGPCCSASDMASLTLLYFDEEKNIKYSKVPNMRVEACGCA